MGAQVSDGNSDYGMRLQAVLVTVLVLCLIALMVAGTLYGIHAIIEAW